MSTQTYTQSTSIIPNQERGFFQYTETHYKSDNSGYSALSSSTLSSGRTGTTTINSLTFPNMALVFRYFYMEKFRTLDIIDSSYIAMVDADLAAVRSAGCKIVIRFAYDDTYKSTSPWTSDPQPGRALFHIAQLCPTINKYADIVTAVEAGVIGTYGEWFYTSNFLTGSDPNTITTTDTANRNLIIQAWLRGLDARIFVLVRYLGSRQQYLGTTTANPGGDAVRIGMHNDAFLADSTNYGTYINYSTLSTADNRTYLTNMLNVPRGGESATQNSPMTDWSNALSELSTYRFDFLNPNYYPAVLTSWGQSNIDTCSKNLGYRLRLTSATIPDTSAAAASIAIQLVVANDGWDAPFRSRPVQIIFDNGSGTTYTRTVPTDIRTWTAGATTTINASITAPSTAGTFNTYLLLPDPTASLQSTPAYSIQLANTSIWDSTTGRHNLGASIVTSGTTYGEVRTVSKATVNSSTVVLKAS